MHFYVNNLRCNQQSGSVSPENRVNPLVGTSIPESPSCDFSYKTKAFRGKNRREMTCKATEVHQGVA